jgi:putative addiction module component (TIGR02574 family)
MVDRNPAALADQLLALPDADRARLAALLLASLEGSEQDAEGAWNEELARRGEEFRSGLVSGIPAADVFAEVERRLGR